MTLVSKTFELFGKTYVLEAGELAKQATGAALVKQGDSTVLTTVVVSKERKNYDFFPLTVDFNEKMYAAGRIPGGYLKREGRPSEKATLTARMIDRPIRPSFPDGFRNEVQVVATSLVADQKNPVDVICVMGASLAMTIGGVPIKRPVSGLAMGLIQEEGKTVVLSDIQGLEDFLGDMDFKVTGTERGITALQMDNKATGLTFDILRTALEQAKEGRAFILDKMLEVVPGPREDTRATAPKIQSITIPTENIRDVIGKGGETIRGIQDETGASIDIHEDGTVYVGGVGDSVAAAIERIELIVKVPEVGEEYTGRVVSIQPFGAFVNLLPGKDGLLHISRVAQGRVEKVEDVLNVGDEVKVTVIEIDDRGKISLDRLDKPEAPAGSGSGEGRGGERRERGDRPGRGARDTGARGFDRPARRERGDRPRRPGDNGGTGRAPRRHHEAE